jgi:hypothetical protein
VLADVTGQQVTLTVMSNMYQPPSGGPQDNWPTEEFRPSGGQPRQPSGGRQSVRWGAGIALAALLAGGGALAATVLTSSSPANSAPNPGQVVALNTILSSASSPAGSAEAVSAGSEASGSGPASPAGSASSGSAARSAASPAATADAAALSPNAAPAVVRSVATRCRRAIGALRAVGRRHAARVVRRVCRTRRLVRLRALGGLHGQFTVKTKSGAKTIGFARGVIESVNSTDIVIKSADNTLWTWDLVSTTVVRQSGQKVTASALKTGEQVFAGGPVASGANDARLIVIRPASSSSASPSSGS